MEKLDGTSMNLVQENIKKLKEIFPEIFIEGRIDFELLRQICHGGGVQDLENSKERYSLTWNGKSEARQIAQEVSTGTLRPAKEESKNWDNTENIYIEGDNLEVLKLLQKSYHGKIKMIYIDPPYNTGKDFVYKDNFTDNIENYKEITGQINKEGIKLTTNTETNGRYHSDWLNMMYPRLKLARNLLTDDGVIFISIDDNEQANLKKICDEIFGEENFISPITIIVKTEGRRYGYFAKTHEQVLIYSKNLQNTILNEIEIEGKKFTFFDKNGGYNLKELRNQNTRAFNENNRPNLRYPFYVDLENVDESGICRVSVDKIENTVEVYAIEVDGLRSVWRWGKETSRENIENLGARKGDDGIVRIFQKYRKLTEMPKTVWMDKKYISNKGTKEIQEILGSGIFDFPKPINLIKTNLEIGTINDEKDIILDFFSGSATTAHSVMQLNVEDGGNRKYIMVQLPELCDESSEAYKAGYKNICEIGKERIRRAGEKIKSDESLPLENREKLDIGFKVFKLDSSNIKEWDINTEDLQQTLLDSMENIKSDRNSLDVLYEILLKYGLDLNIPIEENKDFYSIGGGSLLVSLNQEINNEVIDSICEEYKKSQEIDKEFKTTVILRDNSFKNDVDKTNAIKKLEQVGINEIRSI